PFNTTSRTTATAMTPTPTTARIAFEFIASPSLGALTPVLRGRMATRATVRPRIRDQAGSGGGRWAILRAIRRPPLGARSRAGLGREGLRAVHRLGGGAMRAAS